MEPSKIAFPFDAYRNYRKKQSAETLSAQLEAFSQKVGLSKGQGQTGSPGRVADHMGGAVTRAPAGDPKQSPSYVEILDTPPPYSSGHPNPDQAIQTPGSNSAVNIEAFGNPANGRLSVGISGGRIDQTGFTRGPGNPEYFLQMPERWLGGDAISSTASVSQIIEFPPGQRFGANVVVEGHFGWVPDIGAVPHFSKKLIDPNLVGLSGAVVYNPGSVDSTMSGFVGVCAYFELAGTLMSESEILGGNSADATILNLGVNAVLTGETPDNYTGKFLFRDWAFDHDIHRQITIQTQLPLVESARQLIVEATVRLIGMRGGVNDPQGGYINAAFADRDAAKTATKPSLPCPFAVRRLSAHML